MKRCMQLRNESIISKSSEKTYMEPPQVIPTIPLKETLSEDHQVTAFPGRVINNQMPRKVL